MKKIFKYVIALCTPLTAIISIIFPILSIKTEFTPTQHNGSESNHNTNNTTGNRYHFGNGNSFGNTIKYTSFVMKFVMLF